MCKICIASIIIGVLLIVVGLIVLFAPMLPFIWSRSEWRAWKTVYRDPYFKHYHTTTDYVTYDRTRKRETRRYSEKYSFSGSKYTVTVFYEDEKPKDCAIFNENEECVFSSIWKPYNRMLVNKVIKRRKYKE